MENREEDIVEINKYFKKVRKIMKKRGLALLMIMVCVMGLVGCVSSSKDTNIKDDIKIVSKQDYENKEDEKEEIKNDIKLKKSDIGLSYYGSYRSHAAYITDKGELYLWGNNKYGQIGNGKNDDSDMYKAVKILDNVKSVSLSDDNTSLAVTVDGELYTWGYDGNGLLGNDTRMIDSNLPIKIMDSIVKAEFGTGNCAAINTEGELFMWGQNYCKQVGVERTGIRFVPVKIMENVKDVSLGGPFSAAVTNQGELYTWGENSNGQLGVGYNGDCMFEKQFVMDHVINVELGFAHGAAITEHGELFMWGYNKYGQLGNGTTTDSYIPIKIMENVKDVKLGEKHSVILTNNGEVYVCGDNTRFQLGIDGMAQYKPVKILENISEICAGAYTNLVVSEKGNVYMWGQNESGIFFNEEDINLKPTLIKEFSNCVE